MMKSSEKLFHIKCKLFQNKISASLKESLIYLKWAEFLFIISFLFLMIMIIMKECKKSPDICKTVKTGVSLIMDTVHTNVRVMS